ncbi:MAG: hypothetical protein JWN75_1206 [Candidatus Saccharibacteria bacterium]|nr:hypothetical protein [Candidatus Saccharibacteria bacterium]
MLLPGETWAEYFLTLALSLYMADMITDLIRKVVQWL